MPGMQLENWVTVYQPAGKLAGNQAEKQDGWLGHTSVKKISARCSLKLSLEKPPLGFLQAHILYTLSFELSISATSSSRFHVVHSCLVDLPPMYR